MIGKACASALETNGFKIYPLNRNNSKGPHYYLPDSDYLYLDPSIRLHGVINLGGQDISKKRWNPKIKKEIVDSRINLTRSLSEALVQLPTVPEVFLSASAIGYYGADESKTFDENSTSGNDFLAKLALDWETACKAAENKGIRTVKLRFGLVLCPEGGILKNLILPLRLACVGAIGSGEQMMSWISLNDTVRILTQLMIEDSFSGPLNLVSNQPVSSRDFSYALAQSIKRYRLPRIPSYIVRLMFGEIADAALLPSASVKSIRMTKLGIELEDPELSTALKKMFN